MEIKRCERGHLYDAEINSTCPQCQEEGYAGNTGAGVDEFGHTEPFMTNAGPSQLDQNMTMPSDQSAFHNEGGQWGSAAPDVEDYDSVTEAVITNGIAGFTPVVGWLVSVDGPSKGTDYRIHTGYNYIGRADHSDIAIKGDQTISREKHALVGYDDREKVFFFAPSDGKSIVRVNGKMIMSPVQLNIYDRLTIGNTELMFVPLCGDKFSWDM